MESILENLQTYLYIIYAVVGISTLVQVASMWMIYTKAGQPGWACLIPIYGSIVLMRIIGRGDWYWLLAAVLMPVCGLGLIWVVIILNDLAKSFGKPVGFTIGLIFFPIIFLAILGFGKDPYVGPAAKKVAA